MSIATISGGSLSAMASVQTAPRVSAGVFSRGYTFRYAVAGGVLLPVNRSYKGSLANVSPHWVAAPQMRTDKPCTLCAHCLLSTTALLHAVPLESTRVSMPCPSRRRTFSCSLGTLAWSAAAMPCAATE